MQSQPVKRAMKSNGAGRFVPACPYCRSVSIKQYSSHNKCINTACMRMFKTPVNKFNTKREKTKSGSGVIAPSAYVRGLLWRVGRGAGSGG